MSSQSEITRSRNLVAEIERSRKAQELLELLPQGHGSGLDADKVDGLHAVEIIAKSQGAAGGGGGEGGAGGGGDMYKSTYDKDEDGVVDDSEKIEGSTKAEVQDHTPKAHTLASHSTKNHGELENIGENDHHSKVHGDTEHSVAYEKTANKGQANGYCDLDGSSKVPTTRMPTAKIRTTLSFAVTGTLTTGTDKAPTLLAPCSLTIIKVKLVVKTAPTGQAIIVDINKNGTTIFPTQANRPQIAAGETTGDSGTPDVTALVEGDKVTVDVDQVGSTVAGADLTAEVVCEQAVVFG